MLLTALIGIQITVMPRPPVSLPLNVASCLDNSPLIYGAPEYLRQWAMLPPLVYNGEKVEPSFAAEDSQTRVLDNA